MRSAAVLPARSSGGSRRGGSFSERGHFIPSGPTWALAVEGEGAIATMRKTIGATNPANAEPGTIRGDLAVSMPDNLVHGSDSPESAEREAALWFSGDELG